MPDSPKSPFSSIPEAVAEMQAGRMVVVIDDEDRENEGDLTLAAEFCTPEVINFMAKFGRGLICLTLTEERADFLRLGPMTQDNTSRFGTAFTETIEAREGVTTGISAADRAHTIQVAISPGTSPTDLARPGHVFPLRARRGGVLVRAGQTEASVDLARIAGLIPAGVICEIMNDDGTMARVPDLIQFCREHDMKMVTVAELIKYRLQHERYVSRSGEGVLPTEHGEFRMIAYNSSPGMAPADAADGAESHVALVYGDIAEATKRGEPLLVRVHTHCLAGNVFGSKLCDCHATVEASMEAIAKSGAGILLYLHHTQRGFGIDRNPMPNRLILHQSGGRPASAPVERDSRELRVLRQVGLGGQILSDLGVRKIRLLTNHPTHVPALHGYGIEIVGQQAIPVPERATSTKAAVEEPDAC
ncbi:3,4-dihydroxy 2-butanone 4-phosphate synthase / GTP cyclohydrolase II [Bryocella elongata]|uniref:3,4-dihydroxy-2-butanone 4-phosphate synthase n=1 Tax=Bryocella elongata TaxID=863522 RepID=A0A1H5UB41_9BACT|nr:3,4-dihydroxy-2-butanone-4-phosphate synthase [Bryocella elongata]SEF72256.1 3,4-dihydroxy 2-butanone 4-phosphate synthase / GTP cyclohydrolase II [Bryocella elongata]